MNIIYTLLIVAGLMLLAHLLLPYLNIKSELSRKLIHAGTGVAAFLLPYFLDRDNILLICAIFTLFLLSTRRFNLLPGIHAVARKTHGEFYFPHGLAASAFFFLPENILAFQFGCLVLGLSDTAADLVGSSFGKHKIPLVKDKSFEGSIAFFITTLIIFLCLFIVPGHVGITIGIGISLGLTVIESMFSWGLDNLILPAIAGLLVKIVI